MMTFGRRLSEKKESIVQRWLDDALAIYSPDSAAAFRRQKDPFANPVGHSLRQGLRDVFEAMLDGRDAPTIRRSLQEVIRIRAVQQCSASQAVGFVFRLREAVRAELGEAASDGRFSSELANLDGRIDQLALDAFDMFVECRERVCELRVNEAKRRVAWIVDKLGQRGGEAPSACQSEESGASEGMSARREGSR